MTNPSDRETLARTIGNTHRNHDSSTGEITDGDVADAVLAWMTEQGFSRPRPWREDATVRELREEVRIEGSSWDEWCGGKTCPKCGPSVRRHNTALDALCDRVAACGAGGEESARLVHAALGFEQEMLRGQVGLTGDIIRMGRSQELYEAVAEYRAARHPAPQEERP